MRFALLPISNRQGDVEDYVKEIGHQEVKSRGWVPSLAQCPYCPASLTIRAQSPKRIAHFVHPNGAVCPSMAPARSPYHKLTPGSPNQDSARVLAVSFLKSWPDHYAAVKSLVPFLTLDEFEELVSAATQANSWAWVGMEDWCVPYMLVLQHDYGPQQRPLKYPEANVRILWFRFWFHHEPKPLDFLWTSVDGPPTLMRASYRLPRGQRRPTPDNLTREPMTFPVDQALLLNCRGTARLTEKQVLLFERRIRSILTKV